MNKKRKESEKMPKKLIRDEKYVMLTKQISQLEKDLITIKNEIDKNDKNYTKFMIESLKTTDKIIKNLKLSEEVIELHTSLHTQNIKKIKNSEWLAHFCLGMNLGIVLLLVFLKIKGAF